MKVWCVLCGLVLLGLLPASAVGHELSPAEIETLVRQEIVRHEQHRRRLAFCSDMNERIIQRAEKCIERHEIGLSTTCQVTPLIEHAAALRTVPICAEFAAIAKRCEQAYGPNSSGGTLVKNQTFFACMKHPPIDWFEEAVAAALARDPLGIRD